MKPIRFGTDGIRGVANQELTSEVALVIGQAAGRYLITQGWTPRVVLGRDTRRSGPMLGAALAAGFCSVGVESFSLGIVPTGAISFVARTGEFGMGAVISASHNPAPDNGIKLIAHDGRKLPDQVEREIERLALEDVSDRPAGAGVGRLLQLNSVEGSPIEGYMAMLEAIVPERLDGMKIAVDGAHGAAFELGPAILRGLGAEVFTTGCEPDGMNINENGGATKPETIQKLTVEAGAAIGIAFDGDADRAVFSDCQGRLINGDRTMAIWCAHWHKHGEFTPQTVVGTVMSNGGFEAYMVQNGVHLERAQVGDKYVSQKMVELDAKIGGEQSGHLIFSKRGPTGDGLITALELLRVLKREGRTAASFYNDYESWPQILLNIGVKNKDAWSTSERIADAVSRAETELVGHGRINVRPSGTQPMVRVMVEADSYELRDRESQRVVEAIIAELGGEIYGKVDLTHALGD